MNKPDSVSPFDLLDCDNSRLPDNNKCERLYTQTQLNQALQEQIEKDARIIEGGCFLHEETPVAGFAREAAQAIRAQKGE